VLGEFNQSSVMPASMERGSRPHAWGIRATRPVAAVLHSLGRRRGQLRRHRRGHRPRLR
jgi:hypothetical protein